MAIILSEIATLKTIAADGYLQESYYHYHGEDCTYIAVADWFRKDDHVSCLYKIPGIVDFEIAAHTIGDFGSTFACKCQIHGDIVFGERIGGEHIGGITYNDYFVSK